ncbi:MAG TPA: hypothetical protein PKE63_09985 [Lacibacter sp.]|nr:hypothetical protein [Lacibacter sp.]HMO88003.1 hypothetical protein [Lacibacter sp.]HMP87596.1 hypothetical protein [Lacibacter sp.]
MKKLWFLLLVLVVAGSSQAQNEKYVKAMGTQLVAMSQAGTPAAMQEVVHGFERIAKAEKNQWLAYYYAGLSQVWHAFLLNDPAQYDALADKAEAFLEAAEALVQGESELAMLAAMVGTLRMAADPMSRFMQYSPRISQYLELAKQLNPGNPRPYFWQGQSLLRTPEQFGGGCANARPLLEEALRRFTTFEPATPLHPVWGKPQTEQLLGSCK